MTVTQFDNGYWYSPELKAFAMSIGVPSASKMRKDQLEKEIKQFLQTGKVKHAVRKLPSKTGIRDIDRGLKLSLPILHYTSKRQTKDFILKECLKMDAAFVLK